MAKIKIEQMSADEAAKSGITNWPVWTKEISEFDWHYDNTEKCYILEGRVKVKTDEETVEINPGDFVTFPQGLSCVWEVIEPVKKHYTFE